MHRGLGSATLSQLTFPWENNPNFPWEISHRDSTVVKTFSFLFCIKKTRTPPVNPPKHNLGLMTYSHCQFSMTPLHRNASRTPVNPENILWDQLKQYSFNDCHTWLTNLAFPQLTCPPGTDKKLLTLLLLAFYWLQPQCQGLRKIFVASLLSRLPLSTAIFTT